MKKTDFKGNKAYLETKVCLSCHRPFSWRKKWANCWHEVKYCSDKCRQNKSQKVIHE